MSKLVYCIRHGLAEHNINYFKYGSKTFYDPKFTDTCLVQEGIEQATNLRDKWLISSNKESSNKESSNKESFNPSNIELVIISPLMRTLQTADILFKGLNIPMIALECVREYPCGLHTCNKRSSKDEYKKLFPSVDFSDLQTNYDEAWFPLREETIDELNIRIETFKKFIQSRSETNIAFVNHNSFIGQMKDQEIKYMDNGLEELQHCHPYLIKL